MPTIHKKIIKKHLPILRRRQLFFKEYSVETDFIFIDVYMNCTYK